MPGFNLHAIEVIAACKLNEPCYENLLLCITKRLNRSAALPHQQAHLTAPLFSLPRLVSLWSSSVATQPDLCLTKLESKKKTGFMLITYRCMTNRYVRICH